MLGYYGIKCEECKRPILLEVMTKAPEGKINFYTMPITPIKCPACGHEGKYGSTDAVLFEVKEVV